MVVVVVVVVAFVGGVDVCVVVFSCCAFVVCTAVCVNLATVDHRPQGQSQKLES